jgi:hypothetical protein
MIGMGSFGTDEFPDGNGWKLGGNGCLDEIEIDRGRRSKVRKRRGLEGMHIPAISAG